MSSSFANKLIRRALGLLGFAAVSCDGEPLGTGGRGDDVAVMYGVPTVEFRVSGKVTDGNSDVLEGISVTRFGEEMARSSEEGSFEFTTLKTGFGRDKTDTIVLNFHDGISDREGGAYKPVTQNVIANKTEEGSGFWDNGTYVANDVKVEMTR